MTHLSENNIEKAHRIVEAYYAGVSTPAELSWVNDYFRTVSLSELPEDLRSDAEIFTLMDMADQEIETSVPDDLEDRIKSVMIGDESAGTSHARKRGLILRFGVWSSAAAAVILMIVGIISFNNKSDDLRIGGELVASLENAPDEDGYVEITDATDAARIIAATMKIADYKITTAYSPVKSANDKMKKIDDKLNKILNHKSLKAS